MVDSFVAETLQKLSDYEIIVDKNSKRSVILVETREHPHLLAAVKNIMFFIGSGWNLQIFHGANNSAYVRRQLSGTGARFVKINEIYSLEDYSELLTTIDFWRKVDGSKLLVMQTDSFMRKKGVDAFLDYDYVGAPWKKAHPFNLPDFSGGNGGISLRSKPKLIQALKRVPYNGQPEDYYFVHALNAVGARIAPREICQKFGVEANFTPDPLAIHAIDKYLHEDEIRQLLDISYHI